VSKSSGSWYLIVDSRPSRVNTEEPTVNLNLVVVEWGSDGAGDDEQAPSPQPAFEREC